MKVRRIIGLTFLVLIICSCFALMFSCGGKEPDEPDLPDIPDTPSTEPQTVYIFKDGKTDFSLTYSNVGVYHQNHANKIFSYIAMENSTIERYEYTKGNSEKEILIGATDRQVSKDLVAAVNAANESGQDFVWGFCYKNGKLAFYANSEKAFEYGWDEFYNAVVHDDGIYCLDNISVIGIKTYAEYMAEINKVETAKRNETLKALRASLSKYNVIDFGELPRFNMSGTVSVPKASEAHPKVWLNSETLPDIIKNLAAEENKDNYNKVKKNAEDAVAGFASLGPLGPYNHDVMSSHFAKMESAAFMYLVTDDDIYGYTAILYAFNFIETVQFSQDPIYQGQHIPSGSALMILGEVYDWCYDLFMPKQRQNFVIGAVNNVGSLMEYDFPPPSNAGGVTGHTTGTTILRNSLAFAIAVSDDFPSIYNCIASIIINNFIDAPNFYYQSGTHHQGTNYGAGKTAIYVYSELLMSTATGVHLYDVTFEETLMSFIYRSRPDGEGIRIGDDYLGAENYRYGDGYYKNAAFLAASLYGNAEAKAWYMASGSSERTWDRGSELTPVFCLIYNDPTIEYTSADRFTLPLVKYSGSPSTMLIARSAWNDADAWLTYTNMEEAYAANHDHKDAGTFQIYYKGILAPDAGQYQHAYYQDMIGSTPSINQAYGSAYDSAYVKQTISKNGLLIYNPNMKNNGSDINNGLWIYTGGQTIKGGTVNESGTLQDWEHKGITNQTTVLGKAHAYDSNGDVLYAYISGDITNAYDAETVDLVMRSTMTLATGDAEHPMAFIVYDRITSDDANYKKTFLLHTMDEPVFSDGTKVGPTEDDVYTHVTDTNSFYYTNTKGASGSLAEGAANEKYNGKLTLTTLLPENPKYSYVGGDGKRFWVNGQNVGIEGDLTRLPISEVGWGRVEMSPTEKNKTDSFLNVMYIGDAYKDGVPTSNTPVAQTLVQGTSHEGVAAFGSVVMFSKTNETIYTSFDFTVPSQGSEEFDYYVGGLAEGRWQIKVGDAEPFNRDVIGSESMLTFSAKTGDKVTITPVFEKLTLELNGGAFTEYVPAAYYPGEVYTLPTAEIMEKYAHTFGGWYDNAELEGTPVLTIPADATGEKTYYAKWDKSFGVITYHLNNGSYNGELPTANKRGEAITLPTGLLKENCTFIGWYETSNFTGNPVTEIPADDARDWTLYAKFDGPIVYSLDTVTHAQYFLTNDLFGDALADQSDGIFTVHIDTANKDNTHWDDGDEWAGAASIRLFNPLVGVNVDNPPAYQLFFLNFEDGKMVTYSRETVLMYMNSGDTVDVVFNLITRALDYYVNGMFITTETASESTVAPDLRYYNSSMAPFDTSFYKESTHATSAIQIVGFQKRKIAWDTFAIYLGEKISERPQGYGKLTLNLDGGESKIGIPAGYSKDTGYTLPAASDLFKHGFEFKGWYDNPELSGTPVTEIAAGTEGDKTYYAKWEKVFGIISYVMNGGTAEVALPADNIPGEIITIPSSGITKPGCEFIGWFDNAELTGAPVTELAADNSADVTLYAKFQGPPAYNTDKEALRNIYLLTDVKFGSMLANEGNGKFTLHLDTAKEGNVAWDYNGNDFLGMRFWNSLSPIDNSGLERSVYLFDFRAGNMVTNKGSVLVSMNSGDIVDIVVDITEKTLTYYVNGILAYEETEISGFADDLALYDGASSTYDTTLYTDRVAGAIQLIGGYDRRLCCDLIAVYVGEKIPEPPAGYNKLTLNTNGGTVIGGLPAGYYTDKGYTLPSADSMEKRAHKFLGWYDNEDLTGEPITSIPVGAAGEKIYYAKWEADFGTLTFHLDGGAYSGSLPTQNIVGEALELPLTGIAKSGFVFAGWYNNPLFTGEPIKSISENDKNSYEFYARYVTTYYTADDKVLAKTLLFTNKSFGTDLCATGKFTIHIDTAAGGNASWDGTANNGIRLMNSLISNGGSESHEVYLINFKSNMMVTNAGSELIAMNSGNTVDIVVDCMTETVTYYVNGVFKCTEVLPQGSIADDLKLYDGSRYTGIDNTAYAPKSSTPAAPLELVNDSARKLAYDNLAVYLDDVMLGTSK